MDVSTSQPRGRRPFVRRLMLGVLAAALVAAGMTRLRFNADVLSVLPSDLSEVQGIRLYVDHFSQRDELIVTVDSNDPAATESATGSLAGFLRGREGLAREVIAEPAWESAAEGSAELAAYLLLNRTPSDVRAVAERLAPERINQTLSSAMDEIASGVDMGDVFFTGYDPLGLARAAFPPALQDQEIGSASEFVSDDGTLRVLYVRAPELGGDYRKAIDWVARMRDAVETWRREAGSAWPGVVVRFTGDPAFGAEISSSMQQDMQRSGLVTLVLIGAIFFLFYRRVRPMLALVGMLMLVFLVTLIGSSLFLGGLTVISAGFASILIGLTVDYGLILYQRSLAGDTGVQHLRRAAWPGIAWAALTTAVAFLALSASHFPGLAELGKLVAFGVAVGAGIMLWLFTPVAAGLARRGPSGAAEAPTLPLWTSDRASAVTAAATAVVVVVAASGLLVKGAPPMLPADDTLRPRQSEAYDALETMSRKLAARDDPFQVLVRAPSLASLRSRLDQVAAAIDADRSAPTPRIASAFLPGDFIPSPSHQAANLDVLGRLAAERDRLRSALDEAGFTEDAFSLAGAMLDHWGRWREDRPVGASESGIIFPTAPSSLRLMRRILSLDEADGSHYAMAILEPAPGASVFDLADVLRDALGAGDVFPVSWGLLSERLSSVVRHDMLRMLGILAVGVGAIVIVAFRSLYECLLTGLVLALNLASLLGSMAWLGLSWNFVNLGALLLALGAGLDYSIHLLLSLREHGGNIAEAHRQTGFALLICAASTVAGFGSLAMASNLGLASLGQVCALALGLNALISLFLLPWIWQGGRRLLAALRVR